MDAALKTFLANQFHTEGAAFSAQPVGGGSINHTYRVFLQGKQSYFCKVNSATKFPHLFQKEESGLRFIAQQGIIKTPEVVLCAEAADKQVLLLEWIEEGVRTQSFWKTFGQQLAALHQVSNSAFGWEEPNYMGSVPQQNNRMEDWCLFVAEQRLLPLFFACMEKGLLQAKHKALAERLIVRLPQFFAPEPPALVHGDLWSGNFLCSEQQPVLIDPALYFGHRSVDLAMTTLFGGFDVVFYEAYNHHYPLPSNYKEQWDLCNLYPLLIHLLLFGSSYRGRIESILNRYG